MNIENLPPYIRAVLDNPRFDATPASLGLRTPLEKPATPELGDLDRKLLLRGYIRVGEHDPQRLHYYRDPPLPEVVSTLFVAKLPPHGVKIYVAADHPVFERLASRGSFLPYRTTPNPGFAEAAVSLTAFIGDLDLYTLPPMPEPHAARRPGRFRRLRALAASLI